MRLLARRKTPTEELKNAAIEALVNALDDDDKRAAKPGMKGVRAIAAGAVIYTAGRAAFKGRDFVREQLSPDSDDDQAEDDLDDEETRAYEEPEAEDYEVDEDAEDEPEAVEDDEPEAYEEEDEPEAYDEDDEPEASEEDEDEPEALEEDDEPGAEPTQQPKRKPSPRFARKKDAQPSLELPRQRRPRLNVSGDRA